MLEVFYEDQELIVVKKPVGMESQETHSFSPDMVSEIKRHIHHLSTKKEEPYVGVIHRLDKPVGGIMVYAKTKEAASLLSRQVRENQMQKMYMAVVCGKPVDNVDNFVDYLLKDERNHVSKIVEKGISGAKRAELRYEAVENLEEEELLTLVKIWLITGRHHQIRAQFAGHGLPLWGDHRYNPKFAHQKSQKGEQSLIALSACQLSFFHPKTKKPMTFRMEPEGQIFQRFKAKPIKDITSWQD